MPFTAAHPYGRYMVVWGARGGTYCGLYIMPFVVFPVAFACVPETIRHLTDNYDFWKNAAEELVS